MKSSDAMFPLISTRLQVNTGLKPGANEKAAPCAELKFQNGKQELNAPFNNKQTP